ncbi:MAG TPA: hypothetical protein PLM53_13025 [Spirochaetota bacterium]|nr:hypothetical protein [Spirochaetota bacterium]HPC40722.1 hypothetical protein [Spirochaetota bacterium]HPL18752.1 hypothetical protein [Spirochaetota bacterium]HQF09369.1 hypothetical protein [Spirochaetota bacterium]HQH98017.1 hypothetical protein [Spirochaetota bacterium]
MKIETTLYIKQYHLKLLVAASCVTGRSKETIISSLMIRLSKEHNAYSRMWERVQYQKREKNAEYHRLHVCLKPGEYEMLLDLRKVFKKSVSLLVAHAIDEYLDEIVNAINKAPDNYPVINYAMNRMIIDNVINWILSWGVTAELLSHPIYCTT